MLAASGVAASPGDGCGMAKRAKASRRAVSCAAVRLWVRARAERRCLGAGLVAGAARRLGGWGEGASGRCLGVWNAGVGLYHCEGGMPERVAVDDLGLPVEKEQAARWWPVR